MELSLSRGLPGLDPLPRNGLTAAELSSESPSSPDKLGGPQADEDGAEGLSARLGGLQAELTPVARADKHSVLPFR